MGYESLKASGLPDSVENWLWGYPFRAFQIKDEISELYRLAYTTFFEKSVSILSRELQMLIWQLFADLDIRKYHL